MKIVVSRQLPAMALHDIDRVRQLEDTARRYPQIDIQTQHVLHAGTYVRTISIPAGVLLIGALIKVPTVVTVSGEVTVWPGEESLLLKGFHVLKGAPGRKQIFLTHADTHVSMSFATTATTVEAAENEFTDEAHLLMSRQPQKKD